MKKKLGICQLGDNDYASHRKNSLKSVENYCLKHGYDWIALSGTLDADVHICYQKPLIMLENFDDYEYIGFLDMDVAIANRAIKIHEFFESLPNQEIFVTNDPGNHDINSGSVWVKTTPLAKELLEAWWDSRIIGVDKPWRDIPHTEGEDQGRLIRLMNYNKLLPSCYISSHCTNIFPRNFKRGDWAIHFMGHSTVDYEPYVKFANENITDDEQELLDIYWLIYGRECADGYRRSYESGLGPYLTTQQIMSVPNIPLHSPAEVYFAAKEILKYNMDFFLKNKGPLYGKFI